jgi:mannosyl-3-phosphoglycerate phosphatase
VSSLLIATDLDGTLLDHDDYSFTAALPALDEIRRRAIPLVLCSSKTRGEMELLQDVLGIEGPFICENGAAICRRGDGGISEEALATCRAEVLAVLAELREQFGFRFTGFADCSTEEIVAMTGLSPEAAVLAAARSYSEPLRWDDESATRDRFLECIAERGLVATQGGRFLTVSGPADKGSALRRLCSGYQRDLTVIALGDSPNDESLLAVADIAVIIWSPRSDSLVPAGPARIIRTREPGPWGWQEAMSPLLAEFQ